MLAEGELISRLVRQNSVVEFWRIDEREFVLKRYHAVYRASDEAALYRALSALFAPVAIRVPEVFEVNEGGNFLLMERVAGADLRQLLLEGDLLEERTLEQLRVLLEVCCRHKVKLDLDPANIIVDVSGSVWVVDPITVVDELSYHAFTVLNFGLLKLGLLRGGRLAEGWRVRRDVCDRFLSTLPANEQVLVMRDMKLYARLVAGWNSEPRGEGFVMLLGRRVLLGGFCRLLAGYFGARAWLKAI